MVVISEVSLPGIFDKTKEMDSENGNMCILIIVSFGYYHYLPSFSFLNLCRSPLHFPSVTVSAWSHLGIL